MLPSVIGPTIKSERPRRTRSPELRADGGAAGAAAAAATAVEEISDDDDDENGKRGTAGSEAEEGAGARTPTMARRVGATLPAEAVMATGDRAGAARPAAAALGALARALGIILCDGDVELGAERVVAACACA